MGVTEANHVEDGRLFSVSSVTSFGPGLGTLRHIRPTWTLEKFPTQWDIRKPSKGKLLTWKLE